LDKRHLNVHVCKRGSKKRPLTDQERTENRFISSVRIVSKHAIAGMKRFGVMIQTLRNKIGRFDDLVAFICAGLWNLDLRYAR
jgi:sulfur relay (sulfurtransferase) complex TusBCD TusD component (DsrE family)